MTSSESHLEEELIEKLKDLKYEQRADIRDRAALERNFREKFQVLNHVSLTDAEFQRLLEEIVAPDVFSAAHTLRNRNAFTRDDGTPLNYVLSQIGIDNANDTADIINTLSHKKVYYYESDRLVPDRRQMFEAVLTKLQEKYNFALHAD